jgi:tRNA nucleotidyltransferase (CCA-adding enzyme)
LVAQADFFGRKFNGIAPIRFEAGEWLYDHAQKLGVLHEAPQPLLMGRDLIDLGLIPSENFKTILDHAYEAQLNQLFFTHHEAIQWLKESSVIAL